ncbi:MAG: transposase [Lachnospiraceae bacterium]|nr:transposase [Lachnospiraceae bacterium]
MTNLDQAEYPPDKIKELYASRWGIETSFRDLKYTVGMLDFHSKKVKICHLRKLSDLSLPISGTSMGVHAEVSSGGTICLSAL